MRKILYTLIFTIVIIASSWFVFPIHYQTTYPKNIRPQFDDTVRTHFQEIIIKREPSIVLLGDSLLELAIDEQDLSDLLDEKVYKIGYPGTGSAAWYLITKTNIANSPYKPQYYVLFFGASMLTYPNFRVSGRYFPFINEHATNEDKLLIRLAYLNQYSKLEELALSYLPPYADRSLIYTTVDRIIKKYFFSQVFNLSQDQVNQAIESVFDTINLDPANMNDDIIVAENPFYTSTSLNFNKQVGKSFLPEIIRLCEEQDIQLILVRMKTLRYPSIESQTEALSKYIVDLSNYLEDHNIPFIDTVADERITEDMFRDIIHISDEGRPIFTTYFAEAIKPYINSH